MPKKDSKYYLESGIYQSYIYYRYVVNKYIKSHLPLNALLDVGRISEEDYKILIDMDSDIKLAKEFGSKLELEDFKKLENIRQNYWHKVGRLRKRIDIMLSFGFCCFCTLTLSDKYIDLKSIKWYLKMFFVNCNFDLYIANEDYGKENGRLHFHFIGCCYDYDKFLYLKENISELWKYGFSSWEDIVINNDIALSRYISKLSFHSCKYSTKNSRVIYSRKFKELENLVNGT